MREETIDEWRARCDANRRRLAVSTHYVYRAHDDLGLLLYVGCTVNPSARMTAHRKTSHWYEFVSGLHLKSFATQREARDAEAAAINDEGPFFNRVPANQFTCNVWEGGERADYFAARQELAA